MKIYTFENKEYQLAPILSRWIAAMIDGFIAGLIAATMVGIPVAIIYHIFRDSFPYTNYQSIGKKAMGIKLISLNKGQQMTIVGLKRHVHTILPLFAIIDGIILLSSPDSRRLGDKWAETIVVVESQ
tara:strand:+ start:6810 stop:7190 length:381 start_codon:yes stop_codon:yes gene_type:complete